MKRYKPKSWFAWSRTLFIFIFVLFASSSSNINSDRIIAFDNNLDKALEVQVMEDNQETIYNTELYTAEGNFVGDLTAYVGDCPLCSGILACHPRTNVLETGVYFHDSEYGKVRIVATSSKYSCGTILRFSVDKLGGEDIIAIAMDRGVGGNDVDLLVEDVAYATRNVGRVRNQEFEVLRYGW